MRGSGTRQCSRRVSSRPKRSGVGVGVGVIVRWDGGKWIGVGYARALLQRGPAALLGIVRRVCSSCRRRGCRRRCEPSILVSHCGPSSRCGGRSMGRQVRALHACHVIHARRKTRSAYLSSGGLVLLKIVACAHVTVGVHRGRRSGCAPCVSIPLIPRVLPILWLSRSIISLAATRLGLRTARAVRRVRFVAGLGPGVCGSMSTRRGRQKRREKVRNGVWRENRARSLTDESPDSIVEIARWAGNFDPNGKRDKREYSLAPALSD